MTHAGLQMFMEKLNQLINCNDNPLINNHSIIHERPQFKLLYEELGSMIQTLFIDQHHDLHELEKLNDMRRRFTYSAEEAQYMVDLFLSGVYIRNNGHFPTSGDFKVSLNLDDVRRSFESVKVEFMSVIIDKMKVGSSPRPERMLNQSAAAAPIPFTRKPQESKKLWDEIVVGLDRNFQKCFPFIKELTCRTYVDEENDFKSLAYLEKLKLYGLHRRMKSTVDDSPKGEPNCGKNLITFPSTLKRLSLLRCRLPWSYMPIIQSLPNLEVLKLRQNAFEGSNWNTDKEFPHCKDLEEIPLEIADIPTLDLIKIHDCSDSVAESVGRIQEEQHGQGNYDVKIDVSSKSVRASKLFLHVTLSPIGEVPDGRDLSLSYHPDFAPPFLLPFLQNLPSSSTDGP
ncbi:hypothetical protein L1987_38222 [Smallanthus sonchifolius]|uniref:Uncharacterized protein n=1 Tax=Smallanthus sonchifolius TaxID=185202 RepID=A0ACB9HL37_9ASTR|nr:hypothetical protein L1987_38222 [Smallanthus sonchifolius]